MVDDQLPAAGEEVGKRHSGLLATGRERGEGVVLLHLNDGEGAALSGEGIAGAGVGLFLFEESETGGGILGR